MNCFFFFLNDQCLKRVWLISLVLVCVNCPSLFGQVDSTGFILLEEARQLRKAGLFDQSNKVALKAKVLFQSQENLLFALETDRLYARNLSKRGDHRAAIDWFENKVPMYLEHLGELESVGKSFTTLAQFYMKLGEYEKGIEFYKQEIEIREKLAIPDDVRLAKIHGEIGSTYTRLGDYKKAVEYLEFDRTSLIEILEPGALPIAIAGYNLANAKSELGLPEEAIELYKEALQPFAKEFGEQSQEVTLVLDAIGTNYWETGATEKALEYYDQAASIHNEILGATEDESSQLEHNARQFFQQRELGTALQYFKLTQESRAKWLGPSHPATVGCYNFIADVHSANREYETALESYQQTIIAFVEGFADTNVLTNPASLDKIRSEHLLLLAFAGKAHGLKQQYLLDSTNINPLEVAFESCTLAHQLVNKLRSGGSESLELWSEKAAELYEESIDISWLLFCKSGAPNYLQWGFVFSESAKSIELLRSIRGLSGISKFNISDSLLAKERQLQENISTYQQFIFNEQRKGIGTCDVAKIDLWEKELFRQKRNLEKLVEQFQSVAPNYFQLKYDHDVTTIEMVQQSLVREPNGTALLQYLDARDHLFLIMITAENSAFRRVEKSPKFEENLNSFFSSLLNIEQIIGQPKATVGTFHKSAVALHKLLIEPVSRELTTDSIQNLIIVADGVLSMIPFEVLLDSSYGQSSTNPGYLIENFACHYFNSATIKTITENLEQSPCENNYAGFAPDYSFDRDSLSPLSFAKHEVARGVELFGGQQLLDTDASKNEFKKTAPHSAILHLAMHTGINHENPNYSKLLFSGSSEEERALHTHEIYNLKLSSRLTILSACETGIGKIRKGEGVINLARAFAYAGCPSVLMSLWKVDDQVTSEIVSSFLEAISIGKSKDEALRQAKLNHLHTADPAQLHPYFWAGLVLIGDAGPITFTRQTGNGWLLLIVGGTILLAALLFRFFHRSSQ